MAINPELKKFLDLPYNFENGPPADRKDDLAIEGLNCQLLVHLVLREALDIVLPPSMRSKEIMADGNRFTPINGEQPELGDIFIFGRENESDFRKLHLAICVGDSEETKTPLLIHANNVDGKVSIWPLDKFFCYEKYQKLHVIKRPVRRPSSNQP